MPGLGEELRAAREARGLSPSEVSERIHIRSVYLESLEAENWSAVAAPVYVRGFIRTYARFLGLDAERAVEYFNGSIANGAGATPAHDPIPVGVHARRRPSPWLWVATLVAAVLVGLVGHNAFGVRSNPGGRGAPTVVGVAPPPASATLSAAPQASVTPAAQTRRLSRRLGLKLTQRSWLLVRVDGTTRLEGIFPAGTRKSFTGAHADVRAGNAAGVELSVNGKSLGVMGGAGDVVERALALARP